MPKDSFKIPKGYFIEKASGKLGIMDLEKYNIYLKKKDLVHLFGIKGSEKALNIFLCRNVGISKKQFIDGKNDYLINLISIVPWITKHITSKSKVAIRKAKKL